MSLGGRDTATHWQVLVQSSCGLETALGVQHPFDAKEFVQLHRSRGRHVCTAAYRLHYSS
jgi:hypothetical protein